jgi:GH24 family phage-related lysozyme (muramidase)
MEPKKYKPSVNFVRLCHASESCRLQAYKCPAGKWTVGWGHTGPEVKEGYTVTQEKADQDFIDDCKGFSAWLNRNIEFKNQNRFDAVMDLIYNIGQGRLMKNKDLYYALKNDPDNKNRISKGFRKHIYANGSHNGKDDDHDGLIDEPGEVQMLPGLITRRERDLKLYFFGE